MKQQTLGDDCVFEGKGLHTGKFSRMVVRPAPADTGILFRRTDLGGVTIEALAQNISATARNTTLSKGEASVATLEHLMSALTGMEIDNAFIELDNIEVPILDGSARFYVEAFGRCGLAGQDAPRRGISLPQAVEIKDEESGAWVRAEPSDRPSYEITVDFNSRVLGVQTAFWDETIDYSKEIAPCRTFVFFHEIEYLFRNNLIQGGDVDNAIVIVEHPVQPGQIERLSHLFNLPALKVNDNGYLNNLELHFPNECARHKLLDLMGDLRLCGGFLNARVTAFKPGHTINARISKAIREMLK